MAGEGDYDEVTTDNFGEFLDDIAKRTGLETERLVALFATDDDWSFIVRTSALIEAALNQALQRFVDNEPFGEWLSKKGLRDKTQLLAKIELLPKDIANAVTAISEARNAAVHDMRAFNFTFQRYMEELNEENKRKFCSSLSRGRSKKDLSIEDIARNPRFAIWTTSVEVVAIMIPPTWMQQRTTTD